MVRGMLFKKTGRSQGIAVVVWSGVGLPASRYMVQYIYQVAKTLSNQLGFTSIEEFIMSQEIQTTTRNNFSFEELNNAIRPLLVKLGNTAPKHCDCRFGCSEIDGEFLRFTSKNNETLYKILGSEYHEREGLIYINVVRQQKHYHAGWQGMMLSRIEVSCGGSTNNLEAELMAKYDELNEIFHELYND